MATNGLVVMTPSSVSTSGGSASINSDGSVTFSGCANFTMDGIFTSDYDNYMINIRYSHDSADWDTFFRYRAGGTDNTDTYTRQYFGATGTTLQVGTASANYGVWGVSSNDNKDGCTMYVFLPYQNSQTTLRSVGALGHLSPRLVDFAVRNDNTTSNFDGIRLMTQSGNFSGLVTVFGFNQ